MVRWLTWGFRRTKPLLAGVACFAGLPIAAQVPIGSSDGPARIFSSDMAVLETQEPRKDLNCTVSPIKTATLGFDLRFHDSFDVTVPLKELAGQENQLTILFRVTPQDHKDQPSYFVQHFRVPSLQENAKGEATLTGNIDLGEGTYHVDWLMRDRSERICSSYWDVDATLPAKDKQIELSLAPGQVSRLELEQFTDEPPISRSPPTIAA